MATDSSISNSSSSKRPADTEQSVDTFAVCPCCRSLGNNLKVCDKCGTPLSADNTAECYTSGPKRSRPSTSATPPSNGEKENGDSPAPRAVVNGTKPSSDTNTVNSDKSDKDKTETNGNNMNGEEPRPVPQALYVNKNVAAQLPHGTMPVAVGHTDLASPQSLFMNVATSPTTVSSAPLTASTNTSNVNNYAAQQQPPRLSHPPVAANNNPPAVAPTANPGFSSGPHVGLVTNVVATNPSTAPTASQAIQAQRPMLAMQVNSTSHGISSLGSIAPAQTLQAPVQNNIANQMQRTVASSVPQQQAAQPAVNFTNSVTSNPSVEGDLSYVPGQVQFYATQIRIGTRKFKPSTPVMVKDDGVLFTLKDYPHAPVLLNARALLRCKVNLAGGHYPVMFLQLERSCMRQIRTIFQISEQDFCDTASVYMKACITIFPLFPLRMTHLFAKGVNEAFTAMKQKYLRVEQLVEPIQADEVIDLLIQGAAAAPAATSSTTASNNIGLTHLQQQHLQQQQQQQRAQRLSQLANSSRAARTAAGPGASDLLRSVAHSADQTARNALPLSSRPPPPYQGPRATVASTNTPQPQISSKSITGAPTLIVPNDPQRWEQMQKNLVSGGVYHVQMSDGKKRYCLWNKGRLLPCVVENSEVQLEASLIRIGSLRATPVNKVRIKATQPAGIHFSIFTQHCGTQNLFISFEDLVSCTVYFDTTSAIFITPSWNAANKIRTQCALGQSLDPAFNVHSKEEHQKHIVLFLKEVHPDQREALLQMVYTSRHMFEEISLTRTLQILHGISTKVQARRTDFNNLSLRSAKMKMQNLVTILSQDIASQSVDDDDDVIMTQEEVGVKCPYTQQIMKEPVRNRICNHNYEKAAILEFMARKKGVARCPYAGCANGTPLRNEDLEPNIELKKYIVEKHGS